MDLLSLKFSMPNCRIFVITMQCDNKIEISLLLLHWPSLIMRDIVDTFCQRRRRQIHYYITVMVLFLYPLNVHGEKVNVILLGCQSLSKKRWVLNQVETLQCLQLLFKSLNRYCKIWKLILNFGRYLNFNWFCNKNNSFPQVVWKYFIPWSL